MILESATPDSIYSVALRMRERDREEFAAVSDYDSHLALAAWLRQRFLGRGMICARDDAGTPVCIGGAVITRPGSATLLFFATDDFPAIALPMTRFITRRFFPELAAERVHRIECVSLASYGEMHRWLETLGLKREGLFPAYGRSREDFVQYGRVCG